MGHTHSWDNAKQEPRTESVQTFKALFAAMQEICPNTVTVDSDTETELWFNGIGDDEYETACFNFTGNGGWAFCKTDRKPYDKFVVACLMAAKELDIIENWGSDGNPEDHEEGEALLREAKILLINS